MAVSAPVVDQNDGVAAGGREITDVADPTAPDSAATKNYVDTHGSGAAIDDAIDPAEPGATAVTRSASKIATLISRAITALGLGSVAAHNITEFPVTIADRATLAPATRPKIA